MENHFLQFYVLAPKTTLQFSCKHKESVQWVRVGPHHEQINSISTHPYLIWINLFKSQDRRLSLPVSVFLRGTDPIKRSPKITLDVESKFWKFPCWKWGTWPFNSHEWPRQNFSLQYQHNINQISEKNKEKYQFGDN